MIYSLLDQDAYTFYVGNAIHQLYPDTRVTYQFINRSPKNDLDENFHSRIREKLDIMSDIQLTNNQADYLVANMPLKPSYIDWLKNYRFQPSQVHTKIVDGNLVSSIGECTWDKLIFWEAPYLALISETYFEKYPKPSNFWQTQRDQLDRKGEVLSGLNFIEFGTRRRYNYDVQNLAVGILKGYDGFQGTSNVHLAREHGVKPKGTMSHQWFMGISALEGLRHANRFALQAWNRVYPDGQLNYALTDTFGSKAFYDDFDRELSTIFNVRQDSGDPAEKVIGAIQHFQSKRIDIDPTKKAVMCSDGLTDLKCRELGDQFEKRIGMGFGIGTYLSNDVPGLSPLKIVVKLRTCNGIEVVKLSDEPGKATGNRDAVRVAKYTFLGTPLDDA